MDDKTCQARLPQNLQIPHGTLLHEVSPVRSGLGHSVAMAETW